MKIYREKTSGRPDNNAEFRYDDPVMDKLLNPGGFPTPHLHTVESPKQILDEDYPNHQWPISGGWGYTQDDACVIELDTEYDGVSFEQKFIEYRTYEELIVFRRKEDRYSGIRVEKGNQALIVKDDRHYDRVDYTVTAFRDEDWEMLREDWQSHDGYKDDLKGLMRHRGLRKSKEVTYSTVGWFDISRFFGKE